VATAALCVEVGLTSRRVAHDNIENNRWSYGRPALAACGSGDAMNELGNGRDVAVGHIHGRHPGIAPFSINDGTNQFSVLIV
jgi:hypothetical protein